MNLDMYVTTKSHRLRDINIHEFSLMNSGIYNGIYIETVDYFNVLTIHKN